MDDLNESVIISKTHHMLEQKRPLWIDHRIEDNIDHLAHTSHQPPSSPEGPEKYMMEKSCRTFKSFGQTTHRYKIKKHVE